MRTKLNFLVLFLYCGLLYWLSDQSRLPTPDMFENEDKLHHFLAYFVMGVFAWRAFAHLSLNSRMLLLSSFAFCSLYGAIDEWHQSFIVGRNSSVLDWLADNIGALLAVLSLYGYSRKSKVTCRLE